MHSTFAPPLDLAPHLALDLDLDLDLAPAWQVPWSSGPDQVPTIGLRRVATLEGVPFPPSNLCTRLVFNTRRRP